MSNWCTNKIYIIHDDVAMIERLYNSLISDDDDFLEEFIPSPEDETTDYSWEKSNWGTNGLHDIDDRCIIKSDYEICFTYWTAWTPPDKALLTFAEMGFKFVNLCYETDVGFMGIQTQVSNGAIFWENVSFDFDGLMASYGYPDFPKALRDWGFDNTNGVFYFRKFCDEVGVDIDETPQWDEIEKKNFKCIYNIISSKGNEVIPHLVKIFESSDNLQDAVHEMLMHYGE